MSSLIQEINHYRKEVVYSQFFRICFPDDVIYEKITPCQNCIWRMVRREEHTKITVKFYLIFPVLFRLKC